MYNSGVSYLGLARELVDDLHPYVEELLVCDNPNCLGPDPCPVCDILDADLVEWVAEMLEEDFGDLATAREALTSYDEYEDLPYGDSEWGQAAYIASQEASDENITVGRSQIHGWGLVARKNLPKGYDIGILSVIFPNVFQDTAYGRYINHSEQPNVELYHVQEGDYIKVGGKLSQDVAQGEEIAADYRDPLAPKPNFIADS